MEILLENTNLVSVVPEVKEAPTADQWKDYSDSGDLFVDGKLVEVRHILYNYTGRHDWPFGNKFIVDSAGTFDRKDPVPDRYIHWNKAKTHFGRVWISKHREYMYTGWIDHKYTGERHQVYYIPLHLVEFCKDPGLNPITD